jgi:DNA polymerase (family 10)
MRCTRSMDKHGVALVLDEIATLLDATGENRFKARAFRTAARAIDKADADLPTLIANDELRALRGVGDATARIIEELVVTGESQYHTQLRSRAPSGMRELLRVPGLGARKISQLFDALAITNLDQLEEAARSGRIEAVKGFGPATQQRILAGIPFARGLAGRRRYHQAEEAAARMTGFIRALPGVSHAFIAGMLRRGHEIVDDLVVVASIRHDRARVAKSLRATAGLLWHEGDDRTVHGRFGDGLTVDVLLVDEPQLGTALLYATGSSAHVTRLIRIAAARGFELTPIALRREDHVVPTPREEDVYAALGLQYVPPELREDGSELDLAERHEVPLIVTLDDLRGCFHCHTTYSDGKATVQEMAEGALALGWRYLGIADHSQNAGYAGGLNAAQIRQQHREIDEWNRERRDELRLLKGIEADILGDGQLDYAGQGEDAVLHAMDYVIGSVHSLFRMERPNMTRRMQRAVADPRLTMLGHATGRLLLIRDGYDVDIDAVIDTAAEAGAAIEINADPHRLDLSWQFWPRARRLGVRTAINPDAHSVGGIRAVRYGVVIARKAGFTPADVINCWPVEDVEAYLKERKARAAR